MSWEEIVAFQSRAVLRYVEVTKNFGIWQEKDNVLSSSIAACQTF